MCNLPASSWFYTDLTLLLLLAIHVVAKNDIEQGLKLSMKHIL